MKIKPPQRILLSRTDGIGDVVLTLPLAGALKQCFPDCAIIFLGRGYTLPVLRACRHVDEFLDWDDVKGRSAAEQADWLAAHRFDTVLHVFPRREIAQAAHKARIPLRIGTSHRWFHLRTCNRLLHFSRKSSDLHEAQLNLRLLEPLGLRHRLSLEEIPALYGLTRFKPLSTELAQLLDPSRCNLILHPKSQGSAKEWGEANWARLMTALPCDRFKLFLSGSPAEGRLLRPTLVQPFPFLVDLTDRLPIDDLLPFAIAADGLIACSTGPLHLAAAVGAVAVGLYPSKRPMHPGRWAPVGHKTIVLEDGITVRYDGKLAIAVERVVEVLTTL